MKLSRWRILALLAVAEFLGMSLWFAPNAVAAELQLRWGLSALGAGWLTAVVQVGFVAGTATVGHSEPGGPAAIRSYFAISALLAALVNATLLLVPGYQLASLSRFVTGFFLAGVYPPAMKMVATWFRARRGLAIGVLVASLTIGKALPYLVRALTLNSLRSVLASRHRRRGAAALHRARRLSRRTLSVPPPAILLGTGADGLAPSSHPARHRRIPGPHVGAVCDVDLDSGVSRGERAGSGGQPVPPGLVDLAAFLALPPVVPVRSGEAGWPRGGATPGS